MKDAIAIEPFTIAVDEAVLTDLRDRIRRTSWPDHPAGAGWEYGTDPGYLRSLLATWADEFDWRSRERELNRLPHYRAQIDGQQVHFIHARGDGPAPLPIVVTSLPGYGFSDPPAGPMLEAATADAGAGCCATASATNGSAPTAATSARA
jgi:Epoxide hydrolase N terminus